MPFPYIPLQFLPLIVITICRVQPTRGEAGDQIGIDRPSTISSAGARVGMGNGNVSVDKSATDANVERVGGVGGDPTAALPQRSTAPSEQSGGNKTSTALDTWQVSVSDHIGLSLI